MLRTCVRGGLLLSHYKFRPDRRLNVGVLRTLLPETKCQVSGGQAHDPPPPLPRQALAAKLLG